MDNRKFGTVFTPTGKRLVADAILNGEKVEVTHLAFGDGGGEEYTPEPGQEGLRHQVFENYIDSLRADPENDGTIIASVYLPESVGGWMLREVALKNGDVTLAVGTCPAMYKPKDTEGVYVGLNFEFKLVVTDVEAVTLLAAPDKQLVTIAYVDAKLDGKADLSHAHSAGDIASGTLPTARGGTGRADGKAVALVTARTINGVNFDGSANISLPDGLTAAWTAAKTIYCAPANVGTGDGSSATNAMALQTALNSLRTVNMNGYQVTLNLAAGNYNGNYTHHWRLIYKTGHVILQCADGVVFNAATGNAISVAGAPAGNMVGGAGFYIRGVSKFANAAGYAVSATNGAMVGIDQGVTLASTGGTAYFYAGPYSYIAVNGASATRRTVTIQNTGTHPTYFAVISYHAYFYSRYVDYVITGTPAFTAFFQREGSNVLYWGNNTFTGAVGAATVRVRWTAFPLGALGTQATIPGIRGPNENLNPAYLDPSQTANRVLRTGTANSNPAWAQVNLTTDVTGVLPAANGGAGVVSKGTRNTTGSWTITGLTIGKPLYITFSATTSSSASFKITSGVAPDMSGNTVYFGWVSGINYGDSLTEVIIPSATSVVLNVTSIGGTNGLLTARQ